MDNNSIEADSIAITYYVLPKLQLHVLLTSYKLM